MKKKLEKLKVAVELATNSSDIREEIIRVLDENEFRNLIHKYSIDEPYVVDIEVGNCPDKIAFVRWIPSNLAEQEYQIEKLCFDPDSLASEKHFKETIAHETAHITFERELGEGKNAHQKKFYERLIDLYKTSYTLDEEAQKIIEIDMEINGRKDIDQSKFFDEPIFISLQTFREDLENIFSRITEWEGIVLGRGFDFEEINDDIFKEVQNSLRGYKGWRWYADVDYENLEWSNDVYLRASDGESYVFTLDRSDGSYEIGNGIFFQKPVDISFSVSGVDTTGFGIDANLVIEDVEYEEVDYSGNDYTDLQDVLGNVIDGYQDIYEQIEEEANSAIEDEFVISLDLYNSIREEIRSTLFSLDVEDTDFLDMELTREVEEIQKASNNFESIIPFSDEELRVNISIGWEDGDIRIDARQMSADPEDVTEIVNVTSESDLDELNKMLKNVINSLK